MTKVLWILIGILCLTSTVSAQSSTNYDLHWNVIGGGGGDGSSANYQMQGTVGQVTGIATSSNYILSAGYWQMAAGENQPPVASFTTAPEPPFYPSQPVTFNASASSDPDGSIASYSWQFGDGNTGNGMVTTHSYVTDGTYTVNLTVTDNFGATNTTSRPLKICMRGDLNCDGGIDWGDVVKCAYMSWGLIPSNGYGADFSDPPNGVDWGDVVKLAYYYWGLIPNL